MSILKDQGFIITVLGALLIFALVVLGKADAEWLFLWLGGAAGPLTGRLAKSRREKEKSDE